LLFRNDRHRHCIGPIADTYGYGHTYAHRHSDGDGHTYADSHANRCTHSHGHANGYTHTDSYRYSCAYANSHIDGHGHTYTDSFTDADSHPDAMHGKMFTDAEAASDSRAACHATRSDSCHAYSPPCTKRQARGGCSCCS
jgi:hypothetical protein